MEIRDDANTSGPQKCSAAISHLQMRGILQGIHRLSNIHFQLRTCWMMRCQGQGWPCITAYWMARLHAVSGNWVFFAENALWSTTCIWYIMCVCICINTYKLLILYIIADIYEKCSGVFFKGRNTIHFRKRVCVRSEVTTHKFSGWWCWVAAWWCLKAVTPVVSCR